MNIIMISIILICKTRLRNDV